MRILLTALALTFALPAAAQTAPAQQPSGDHAQHGQHGQHHGGQHHGDQHHGQGHGQHHAQAGQGCCADNDGNGRPDCCDRMNHGQHGGQGSQHGAQEPAPQGHQGH